MDINAATAGGGGGGEMGGGVIGRAIKGVCLLSWPSSWPSLSLTIARNVRKLFNYNRGVLHLHEACRIDELSRGSVLGLKFSQPTSARNVP